jgi:hypothetical protein
MRCCEAERLRENKEERSLFCTVTAEAEQGI